MNYTYKKLRNGFTLIELMLVIAIIALVAAVMMPREAKAQVTTPLITSATNLPATVNGGTAANQISFLSIPQNGKGLSLQWLFNTSAGTANGTIYIAPSVDGTNVSTNNIWPLVQAAQATTTVIATTNWSGQTLAGYSALCVFGMSNAAASGTYITNKGIIINVHRN